VVDLGDCPLFPVVLLAADLDRHDLGRQRPFDEHHLAVGATGDALGVHVQGAHAQPALGQVVAGRGIGGRVEILLLFAHAAIVSGLSSAPRWVDWFKIMPFDFILQKDVPR